MSRRKDKKLIREVEAALMGPPPDSLASSISNALKEMEENYKGPRTAKMYMSQAEWDDIVKWGGDGEK